MGVPQEVVLYGCTTWAPRRDHYRVLVEKGADVNARDKFQQRALHKAAAVEHPDYIVAALKAIDELVRVGADIHARDQMGMSTGSYFTP